MTPLRTKYIRDLTVRGRAERNQRAYTRYVAELAGYYNRSPAPISYEEVTNRLYQLVKERQLAASTINVALNAVRFLYAITLGRDTEGLTRSVPHIKYATRRARKSTRAARVPRTRPAHRPPSTPGRSGNHRCLIYLGTKARLSPPSSLHCHRRRIKPGWQTVALAQTAQVPFSRSSAWRPIPRQVPGRATPDAGGGRTEPARFGSPEP